jgi:toxin ParE1/3/4
MSHRIKLSRKARKDIENALAWSLDQFGERQHDAYQELIREALVEIADDPTAPPARERPEIRKGIWTFHIARRGRHARHLFVYRLKRNGEVDIVRFLHDAMDLPQHLPKP